MEKKNFKVAASFVRHERDAFYLTAFGHKAYLFKNCLFIYDPKSKQLIELQTESSLDQEPDNKFWLIWNSKY